MRQIIFLFIIFFSLSVKAQSLEESTYVTYMKAQVLMQEERYDEAIRIFNRILREDESFKQALYLRAVCKFELGAYKGTKNDLLSHIELKGISKDVIHLMAKSEYKLDHLPQARSYYKVAIEMDQYDRDLYLAMGDVLYKMDDQNGACEHWSFSADLGSEKASQKITKYCLSYIEEQRQKTKPEPANDAEKIDTVLSIPDRPIEDQATKNETTRIDPDTNFEIEVDESLTLIVGNGIGSRRVESVPDVFIISDDNGRVVIDVCIDQSGKVSEAEFNRSMSSLFKTNLSSLALRKAKEFVFFPSFRQNQCGTITFMIRS